METRGYCDVSQLSSWDARSLGEGEVDFGD